MIPKEVAIKLLENEKFKLILKFNEDMKAIDKVQKGIQDGNSRLITRFMVLSALITLFYFLVEVSIAQLIHQNPGLLLNFRFGFWELGGALALRYVYKKSISVYKSIF